MSPDPVFPFPQELVSCASHSGRVSSDFKSFKKPVRRFAQGRPHIKSERIRSAIYHNLTNCLTPSPTNIVMHINMIQFYWMTGWDKRNESITTLIDSRQIVAVTSGSRLEVDVIQT